MNENYQSTTHVFYSPPKIIIGLNTASRVAHEVGLFGGEKVLIVTDDEQRDMGDAFLDAALALSSQVEMQTIPALEYSGQEPSPFVADKMCQADVILMPLSKSLSWTIARRRASENGARIVSMPGITPETILRTFPQDYR